MRKISRREFLGLAGLVLTAGCSSKDDNRDPGDLLGPSMSNETILSSDYEGSTVNVDVDVSDSSGVGLVRVLYRINGSADPWTEAAQLTLGTGSTYSGSFTMPASDT